MTKKIFIEGEGEVTFTQIYKIPRLTHKYLSMLRSQTSDKNKFDKSILGTAFRYHSRNF